MEMSHQHIFSVLLFYGVIWTSFGALYERGGKLSVASYEQVFEEALLYTFYV